MGVESTARVAAAAAVAAAVAARQQQQHKHQQRSSGHQSAAAESSRSRPHIVKLHASPQVNATSGAPLGTAGCLGAATSTPLYLSQKEIGMRHGKCGRRNPAKIAHGRRFSVLVFLSAPLLLVLVLVLVFVLVFVFVAECSVSMAQSARAWSKKEDSCGRKSADQQQRTRRGERERGLERDPVYIVYA